MFTEPESYILGVKNTAKQIAQTVFFANTTHQQV